MVAHNPSGGEEVPRHPHYTLATMVALGVIGTLLAVGLSIAGLMITASRNSVDDSIVAGKVAEHLAQTPAGGVLGDVVPELTPKAQLPVAPDSEVNVAAAPDVPAASGRDHQAIVEVHFEVVEGVSVIAPDGSTTETWGYRIVGGEDNALVIGTPGPIIRARVGDVLRFTITNPADAHNPHNVDFHAVTGPGGGAGATTVAPGETKTIEARLLYPGFFMYHCAYGDIPAHIAHGMFGGILVDPETPLPDVDHEWYITQSEYYTTGEKGGEFIFDRTAATMEHPSHVVFNGAVGAIAGDNALRMNVGERSRIYFINAGLNLDSNLHPIGSHWDKVYPEATLLSIPLRGSQTTLVPAGGGTVVEMVGYVPGTVVLVDHALTRAVDKGAIGEIVIAGDVDTEIFDDLAGGASDPGHDMSGDHGDHTPTPPAGGEVVVAIVDGAWQSQPMGAADEFAENENPADYSPNVITITKGTTVKWVNEDPNMMHTVTEVGGAFDSGFFNTGESWSYTFNEVGEFEYYCLPHPWMRGKVVVSE